MSIDQFFAAYNKPIGKLVSSQNKDVSEILTTLKTSRSIRNKG